MSRALHIPLIDSRRGRRVLELLVVLVTLSLADLFFTIWAHFFTDFHELNPIARGMLAGNLIEHLVVYKLALTGVGVVIFWRLRKHMRAEMGLWLIVGVYVMLTVRWGDYTIGVQNEPMLAADEPVIILPLPHREIRNFNEGPQIAPDAIIVHDAVAAVA